MKSKRTLATSISNKVRQRVRERDQWCIFCGKTGHEIAHIIPRSGGGLGIRENLVLACTQCHRNMDFTSMRKEMLDYAKSYLEKHYPGFKDEERIYRRWSDLQVK